MQSINLETERLYGDTWLRNVKENVKNPMESVGKFKDTLKGKHCILIGAGPSLRKNIKDVKGTTFAVLHSLSTCYEHDLYPDYAVHIDAMGGDVRFVSEESKHTTLICHAMVSPKVIKAWKGDVVFYKGIRETDLDRRLDDLLPDLTRCWAFGCSMGSALYIADKVFNACKIIFIGNDLAYSDVTHSDGQNLRLPYDIDIEINGEVWQSNSLFEHYKKTMETYIQMRQIRDKSRKVFVNSTEGGILLMNNRMALKEALEI